MLTVIFLAVALAVGFVIGLLVGRKNPTLANTVAATATQVQAQAKKL